MADTQDQAQPCNRGAVAIAHLGKVYGQADKGGVIALDDCSLDIAPNEFIALVGPPAAANRPWRTSWPGSISRTAARSPSTAGPSPRRRPSPSRARTV